MGGDVPKPFPDLQPDKNGQPDKDVKPTDEINLKLSLNLNKLITTPSTLKRNGSKVSGKWKNIHITLIVLNFAS